MSEKVVVAGAGFGGVNAALQLARRGFEVTLIDKNAYHTFVPGLIDLLRERKKEDKLRMDLEKFFGSTSVEFREETILGFDPDNDKVETTKDSHTYDYLVLALGGGPADYGMDISGAETCYNLEQAKELAEKTEDIEDAIIVGSGYVGVEIAGELAEEDIDVTVVDRSTRPSSRSKMETSQKIVDYFNENDVTFKGGTDVKKVSENSVLLGNGLEMDADTVIWSGGVQASEVVQKSFDAGPKGVPVNSGLSSKEHENVFALGDSADADCLKLAQNAEDQAEVVAENIGRNGALKEYEEKKKPLVISMGETAIFEYGDISLEHRWLRKLKDFTRTYYFASLRFRKLRARLGI